MGKCAKKSCKKLIMGFVVKAKIPFMRRTLKLQETGVLDVMFCSTQHLMQFFSGNEWTEYLRKIQSQNCKPICTIPICAIDSTPDVCQECIKINTENVEFEISNAPLTKHQMEQDCARIIPEGLPLEFETRTKMMNFFTKEWNAYAEKRIAYENRMASVDAKSPIEIMAEMKNGGG